MGKAIRASVLVLLLACSAQAGHMQNDAVQPPPPPAPAATEPGEIPHVQPGTVAATLNLLQSLLSLF